MSAALELGSSVGQAVACRALGVPRATLYRRMLPTAPRRVRPTPARALDAAERQTVLDHLHSERFSDKAPAEVYATLVFGSIKGRHPPRSGMLSHIRRDEIAPKVEYPADPGVLSFPNAGPPSAPVSNRSPGGYGPGL